MLNPAIPLALCTLLLAGCQSSSPTGPTLTSAQIKEQTRERAAFETSIKRALARAADLANTGDRDGSFNLMIKVDDTNRIIGCGTRPGKKIDDRLPAYNPKLAQELESICWTSVFPALPASMFDANNKTARIVAPVVVYPLAGLSAAAREQRTAMLQGKAQNDFLFRQLLAPLPIDSVGVATLMLMSDSTGQVQECAASLDPHMLRPLDFKPDDTLLASLVQRCKQLDLSTMPGFVPNAKGLTSALHRIEYTPWKAGLG